MPTFYDLPLPNIVKALSLPAQTTPESPWMQAAEGPCTAALAHLCLTSKPLAALATPHLYHNPRCRKWWLLIRTLLERPDLCTHVRVLYDTWDYIEDDDPSVPPGVLSYRDARLEGVELENMDLDTNRLELVLSLCPDIELLVATVGYNEPFERFPPGSLSKLEQAYFSYNNTEFGIELRNLEPLATMAPNLRRLSFFALASCGELSDTFPLVTDLRLAWTAITADSLRNILTACPNLTNFAFHVGDSTVGGGQFTPREAQHLLACHAPNLKSLALDMTYWFLVLNSDLTGPDILIDSLSSLVSLETLSLDSRCLVPHLDPNCVRKIRAPDGQLVRAFQGEVPMPEVDLLVNLLPASIRSVSFVQGSPKIPVARLLPALLKLASVEPDMFPRLQTVTISALCRSGEGEDAVRAAFEARKIRFEEVYQFQD